MRTDRIGISFFAVGSKFEIWVPVGSSQHISNFPIGSQEFQEFQLVLKNVGSGWIRLDPENVGSGGSSWIQLDLAGCKKNTLWFGGVLLSSN